MFRTRMTEAILDRAEVVVAGATPMGRIGLNLAYRRCKVAAPTGGTSIRCSPLPNNTCPVLNTCPRQSRISSCQVPVFSVNSSTTPLPNVPLTIIKSAGRSEPGLITVSAYVTAMRLVGVVAITNGYIASGCKGINLPSNITSRYSLLKYSQKRAISSGVYDRDLKG